jgi:hypothetical protein
VYVNIFRLPQNACFLYLCIFYATAMRMSSSTYFPRSATSCVPFSAPVLCAQDKTPKRLENVRVLLNVYVWKLVSVLFPFCFCFFFCAVSVLFVLFLSVKCGPGLMDQCG